LAGIDDDEKPAMVSRYQRSSRRAPQAGPIGLGTIEQVDKRVTTTGDDGFDASDQRIINSVRRKRYAIVVADFHDLDLAVVSLQTLQQPAAFDLRCKGGGAKKVTSRGGQRDASPGLRRREHNIGQRPVLDVSRQNQRDQLQFGSGTRQDHSCLRNTEKRCQTIAHTIKPAGYRPLLMRTRQTSKRLQGGLLSARRDGRSRGRGEPDFVAGFSRRCPVTITAGRRINGNPLVASAGQNRFEKRTVCRRAFKQASSPATARFIPLVFE
jgi:hypothetical protein